MLLGCYVPNIGIPFSIPLTEKISIEDAEIPIDQLNIDCLKQYILKKNNKFKKLVDDASELDLWRVNIDDADDVYTEEDIVQKLGGVKMKPFLLFNDYFNQPLDKGKIHIIIMQPPATTGECLPIFYLSNKKIISLFCFLYNVLTIFISAYALY
jgi:hypothetical protein